MSRRDGADDREECVCGHKMVRKIVDIRGIENENCGTEKRHGGLD